MSTFKLSKFELLPLDITKYIILKLDVKDFSSLCKVSKTCSKYFTKEIVANVLHKKKDMEVHDYTLHQLRILYENVMFGKKRIVHKYNRTVIITDNGKAFITKSTDVLCMIDGLENIIRADIGTNFEVFLTKDGKVYIYGDATNVINLIPMDDEPMMLLGINNAVDVSADEGYIIILLSNGEIMILGSSPEHDFFSQPFIFKDAKDAQSVVVRQSSFYFGSSDGIYKIIPYAETIKVDNKPNRNKNFISRSSENYKLLLLNKDGEVFIEGNISEKVFKPLVAKKNSYYKLKDLHNIIYIKNCDDKMFFVDINRNIIMLSFDGYEMSYSLVDLDL
jgi:hypothetical protein